MAPLKVSPPAMKRRPARRKEVAPPHLAKGKQVVAKLRSVAARADPALLTRSRRRQLTAGSVSSDCQHPKRFRLGSDCSGLGSERLAFKLLGIDVDAVFASEAKLEVRQLYQVVHGFGTRIDEDICDCETRPSCDLYVAGPPCQSWSGMGKRAGVGDLKGRGLVIYHCLQYINDKKPRAVVLENVPGMVHGHKRHFLDILTILESMNYGVTWDIINSNQCGLPQSRPRLYIVAIHNESKKGTFTFPKPMKVIPYVGKYLDDTPGTRFGCPNRTARKNLQNARAKFKADGIDQMKEPCFVDIFASPKFRRATRAQIPCITATRGSQGGFYITTQKRMTTLSELARLQGWPTEYVNKILKSGVPVPHIGHAIGNAMSVNVLVRLLPRVAWAAGLIDKPVDPWKKFTRQTERAAEWLPDFVYKK